MKLSLAKKYVFLSLSLVVVLSITAGIAAGNILRSSHELTSAASVNIEVVDNDQSVSVDQSTGITIIERTSAVTVRDAEASYGYILTAKLVQNDIVGATVAMASVASTDCSIDYPCELNAATPTTILTTDNDNATDVADGDTATFTITVSIPAETATADYILDIEYQEVAVPAPPGPPDPGTTHGAMQLLTNENCPTLDTANPKAYTTFDARNGQIYYVSKIGGLCWMMSNLRYGGDGDYESGWPWEDDRYATVASNDTATDNDDDRPLVAVSGTQASTYTDAQIADAGGDNDYTNIAAVGGFYGYLYNWCAAMGGQADACNNTSTSGFDTNVSICPAGWRLPTGGSGGGEFQALITALENPATGTTLNTSFQAVYSGYYSYGLISQGGLGYLWSSTVGTAPDAYDLSYASGGVSPAGNVYKYYGFAVRCVR